MAALRNAGFRTPGRELIDDFTAGRSDVRYFHPEDAAAAEQALAVLRDRLPEHFELPSAPTDLGDSYENVPQGIIEIWLPDLPDD